MKFSIPILLLLLVVLVASVFFLPSRIVRSYIREHGTEIIGRRLDVDQVSVSLFSGAVVLDQLTIFERDAVTPCGTIQQLRTHLDLGEALHGRYRLDHLDILRPDFLVEQHDSLLSIQDVLEFLDIVPAETAADTLSTMGNTLAEGPAEGLLSAVDEVAAPAEDVLDLIVSQISVQQGKLAFRNHDVPNEVLLDGVALSIPGLDVARGELLVGNLSMKADSVRYTDLSLHYGSFAYELGEVEVRAPEFCLDSVAHITGRARLGKGGKLSFQYDGLLQDRHDIQLSLLADSVDVTDFSPYTTQYFGHTLTAGKLSAHLLFITHAGDLISENRLVIRELQHDKAPSDVKAEMKVPFRLALYMLTDRHGVIDLDLPIRGDIDSPRFSYKRLLFRTLGKFLLKVVTNPFSRFSTAPKADTVSLDELDTPLPETDMPLDE